MRVCIHRGSHEIGGTCIEIESQGKQIVLDIGLPLEAGDASEMELPQVPGFDKVDESLLAVIISHPHQDHYGLAHKLPTETQFFIGEATERILRAATLFSPAGLTLQNVRHLVDRRTISLGPFNITPYLVDHSAYDSYAILVEADGKQLFYTGDFRIHGRKGLSTRNLISNPPANVDVLLMEGTNIGRSGSGNVTEDELVFKFVDAFRATKGIPLVWCSGQNIDRLVTVFKACRKACRTFVIDMYTAEILRATGNPKLPQADWDGVRVFLPSTQRSRILAEKAFAVSDFYKSKRIYPEELRAEASNLAMLFRPSMIRDVERAKCLAESQFICSVWGGYLDRVSNSRLMDWIEIQAMRITHIHTSGHASAEDLVAMQKAFPNSVVVPVHLDDVASFVGHIRNCEPKSNGTWWTV